MTETPLYPLSEFTPAEARFDAAPTPPEDTVERVAIALWTQGVAAPEVIDRLWPQVIEHFPEDAEEYRRLARAAIDALKGTALAVFRDQQDPAVQRVLALADMVERDALESAEPDSPESADHVRACALLFVSHSIRAAIGGDGR